MSYLPNRIVKDNDDRWQMTLFFKNIEINLEKNSKDEPIFGEVIDLGLQWFLTSEAAAKLYDLLHLQEKLNKAYPHVLFEFSFDDIKNEIDWKEVGRIIKNSC